MERKTFTLRLSQDLYDALSTLSGVVHRSMNDLAAEAVSRFVSETSKDKARALEKTLARLRSYAANDPNFEKAIDRFAKAEAGTEDPLQGKPYMIGGAARRKVRELLTNG